MPGIVGFVTRNPDQRHGQARVSRMLQCMLHDPSYTYGTYWLPARGCYFGWVSHKGSYAACNPIVDQDGQTVLIFSGEHFSHRKDRPTTDASSLLALYADKRDRFFEELNGWFAGVLIDLKRQSVRIFNDRFGVHRLYYHETADCFAFASEAKSILSVCPETRRIDDVGLGHFLAFGTPFDCRTLFRGVSLMPGASCWSVDGPGEISKGRYFDPETWAQQPPLDRESFYAALRDTVAKIVPSYYRSNGPVGLSLTGGLDTRIVLAGMPADAGSPPSYTYGGIYRNCFDILVAQEVAVACGLTHRVLPLGLDFLKNFATFAEETVWLTDGCLDLCGAHEIHYSRQARQHALVRLTGNYGSEVLRSVSNFKYAPVADSLFEPSTIERSKEAARSFEQVKAVHPVTFAAFKQIPWNLFGRLGAAQSQLVLRSPYMDNELVALVYQAPPHTRETTETNIRLIGDLNPRLAAIPTDLGYGGNDAAPIAVIRRVHRYLQFKAEWYYNVGMPQWLARYDRTVMLRMWEPFFLGTHKIEHYRLWFRDQLRDYLHALLSDNRSRSRPYLNPRGHADLIRTHLDGSRNTLNEVNKVVTLELVHRLLIERDYEQHAGGNEVFSTATAPAPAVQH